MVTTVALQMVGGWDFVAGADPCSNRLDVLVFRRHKSSLLRKAPVSPIRRRPAGLAVSCLEGDLL